MAKDDKLTRDERPTTKEEKLKALDAAISHIEKQYGKGSVMKLGDNSAHMNVEAVPTGSLSLDLALGIGGLPKGRIIEIYGPESSGKTTVALHAVAEVQKRGGIAGFIDAEHALDPVYAKNIGVDIDNLYISQPDCGEQALEIAETMVRSGAVDIVIVDSVAALVPKAEIDGDMGDSHVGLQARLMSQALRKLTSIVSKSNCIVIFINQLREKIGVMFGNPETTTGGRALKFYSSVRLDVRRVEALKQGGEVVGINTETLDGNQQGIDAAKKLLAATGASYRNIYFASGSDAGKFALNIMAFPTTYVFDRDGNVVGQPLLGGIDKEENLAALQKNIDAALAKDNAK